MLNVPTEENDSNLGLTFVGILLKTAIEQVSVHSFLGFASLRISQTSFCMNWSRALDHRARSESTLRVFLKYDYNGLFTKQNIKTSWRCNILT